MLALRWRNPVAHAAKYARQKSALALITPRPSFSFAPLAVLGPGPGDKSRREINTRRYIVAEKMVSRCGAELRSSGRRAARARPLHRILDVCRTRYRAPVLYTRARNSSRNPVVSDPRPAKSRERERGTQGARLSERERASALEREARGNGIGSSRGERADTASPIIRPAVLPPSTRLEQNTRICSVFHLSVCARAISAPLLAAVLLLRI